MSVRILTGDCREILPTLPEASVDCVVTSPPYWGLRDYGVVGQLGVEQEYQQYVKTIVAVFSELWRVLKPEGTAWLNIGDCYHSGNRGGYHKDWERGYLGGNMQLGNKGSLAAGLQPNRIPQNGLKDKDLCMIPARVALALQADGWWLRSEIIWNKPNPMPESVRDRPSCAHEKVFLLTKSERYFYDHEAVRTPAKYDGPNAPDKIKSPHGQGFTRRADKQWGHSRRHAGFNGRWDQMSRAEQQANGANLRNVWTISTRPYPEAHFATFPTDLPETCIRAGCPEGGTVLDPFGGAGTTGLVADRLGRDAILIDLNPDYAEMARRRIENDAPLLSEVS